MIALPLIFLLLFITIIGIPVAVIVLPTGVLLSLLFGKAAIYGLIGRRISGDTLHPSLAVLAGGVLFVLLYLVPVVGLVTSTMETSETELVLLFDPEDVLRKFKRRP